ncbi:hypothetical protein QBC46DRAFT_454406 [Diplogelasinospora grovesii]|uniref:Uncharacterized protein n=1 Tax=Diplogelasinospora grovesii TaxID=303347 RepID=A0AAN6MYC4_9PEZI|nr:hypothetical protein QBC46DRAFT_454406 [Diplogelasinospora grovesii]
MAQNAQNPSKLRVRGCDLFLLEKWEADSPQSPDEQMAQIFARFLELPFSERQAYAQQVTDRNVRIAERLPQAEQDILVLARPYNERNTADVVWLRTYYGPGSDDAFAAILEACKGHLPLVGMGAPGFDYLFSDAARYDYGDAWQRVFGRMPQLLEYAGPGDYEAKRATTLAEGQEWERGDKERVEEDGGEWPEDAMYLGVLYNYYHLASKVGIIYVLDKETLGEDEEGEDVSHDDRQLLAAWYDPDGKTVRWQRMSGDEVCEHMAVINSASIDDHPIWTEAEIGEDYDWDGPLGPPSIAEDGGNEGDED